MAGLPSPQWLAACFQQLTGRRFNLVWVRRRLLELTALEAGLLFLVMLFFETASWLLWGGAVLLFAETRQYVSISALLQMGTLYVLSYLFAGIYACHVWKHRHRLDGERVASFCLFYYFTVMLYAASMSGLFTLAVGVIAIGVPVMTMIFMPSRIMLCSMGYAMLVMLVMGAATAKGWMAYAPMYNPAYRMGVDPGFSLFYVLSQLYIALPVLVMLVLSVALVFSEWRRREGEVYEVSQRDSLTGLYNRRAANARIEWLLARRTGSIMAIILVDLDYFKRINDVHGHLTGDRALKAAAQALQGQLRDSDMLARIGGEEFIIVLADVHLQQAAEVAERCRVCLTKTVVWSNRLEPVTLSASFGVASAVSGDNLTLIDLLYMADQCLYQAKHEGRNRVVSSPGFEVAGQQGGTLSIMPERTGN